MRAMPVVLVQPREQVIGTLVRVGVGASIGPFAESGLDEAFGFAVGARGVGASAFVADPVLEAELPEGSRFVTRAIVGKNALDADSQSLIEGNGSGQESGSRGTLFV